MSVFAASLALLVSGWLTGQGAPQSDSFRFAILGDRTGEAATGVFEQAWRETAAEDPAFVVSVGDSIQGGDDATARAQWDEVERIRAPYRRLPWYPVAGNHDIRSAASEKLFRQYTGHPTHYGFDYRQAHFTMLDNSRSDELSAEELAFLEADLKAHAAQPVKFVFSHRPSWLVSVAVRNPDFALHRLARQFGVQYVVAGHVHQMLRLDLEGVTYLSMPSSGGHLRASGAYRDGWFFGRAVVRVNAKQIAVEIDELKPPHGEGRMTAAGDWGMLGLLERK